MGKGKLERFSHNYGIKTEINGKTEFVRITIRENNDGHLYYDNYVTSGDVIEKTHLSQPDHQTKTGEETNALSKDRLVEWIKNDNDLEAFVVGAVIEVSGTVQKRVKRDGQCKLVIEPGASVPGFVVFADCGPDADTVRNSKIRKGSLVSVRGKFETFGAVAVCLSDCRLIGKK
jgi:hypothetical protein